jgi:hypothetical protein
MELKDWEIHSLAWDEIDQSDSYARAAVIRKLQSSYDLGGHPLGSSESTASTTASSASCRAIS